MINKSVLKWKIRVRRRKGVRCERAGERAGSKKGERRVQKEGREGGRESGMARQPCLFPDAGDTRLAPSLVLRVCLER